MCLLAGDLVVGWGTEGLLSVWWLAGWLVRFGMGSLAWGGERGMGWEPKVEEDEEERTKAKEKAEKRKQMRRGSMRRRGAC